MNPVNLPTNNEIYSKIKVVIFDLDGTIANTLPLCVAAFKKAIEPLAKRSFTPEEIIATFGPTEEGTVRQLIPGNYEAALAAYYQFYEALHTMCPQPFDGIVELIRWLKLHKIKVAMVTGKGRTSALISLSKFALQDDFEIIETGSPEGTRKEEGIRSVLEKLHLSPNEAVYIGDAPADIIASHAVGVPIFAAAWADTADLRQLKALAPDKIFTSIAGLYVYFTILLPASLEEKVLLAFKRVNAIADTGLLYCKDDYGRERYSELKEIAISSIAQLTNRELSVISNFYDKEVNYPTPKVDVRAFIVNEAKEILLVQERTDGKWSLPGGWADVGFTPSESVIKEVKEETGLIAKVARLMAVFDKKKHPHPPQPFYVYKMVLLCEVTGAWIFTKAFDVLDVSFFKIDALPVLSEDRILQSQLEVLYGQYLKEDFSVIVD